jgi:AmiR/NasT family two-component response regulator
MDKFSKKVKETLKKHAKHHSAKHMTMMKKDMTNGDTFTKAHKKAMDKVGK